MREANHPVSHKNCNVAAHSGSPGINTNDSRSISFKFYTPQIFLDIVAAYSPHKYALLHNNSRSCPHLNGGKTISVYI